MVRSRKKEEGYTLLLAIFAVGFFSVSLLYAREMWESTVKRDLEEELIFRGKQYVTAIKLYKDKFKKNPKDLEELYKKKFLRKLFKDPVNDEGEWDLVMESTAAGKKKMFVMPPSMADASKGKYRIVGVCSKSPDVGYRVYREKTKYFEWAFYLGAKEDKPMPEITYLGN